MPLILDENNRIKLDRKKLFSILNKSNNSELEKQWLNEKFKQYGVFNKDLSTLKIRLDEIPVSLAISQAAKETGWGTSRFCTRRKCIIWAMDLVRGWYETSGQLIIIQLIR